MELFDSHFHYYRESEEKNNMTMQDYYAFCQADNPTYLMSVAGSYEGSLLAQEFAEKFERAYFAVGVHPHDADDYLAKREDFSIFRDAHKLKAVGELGLDYFYDLSDYGNQIKVFGEFLALALEWQLPAIVHCRDKDNRFLAYDDCYRILKDFSSNGGKFVVHCYAGNVEYCEKFLELGAYLGVTGMVTFNKANNIRENLPYIPLDRLLIETDSPYLAPIPFRGKENFPRYVYYVAERIGKELNLTTEEVVKITTVNAKKFFNIED